MELYKNTEWKKVLFGNEYIDIPSNVENKKLITLISKIKDGTHNSFKDSKDNDAKILLSAKNIKNSQLVFGNNERKISKNDYEKIIKNGFPQKGDLLFTIVGTIGESMIWDKDYPEAFQRSVSFIRVNEKLNNKYLDYYLRSSLAKNEISKKTKVGAQPGIYLNDLKSLDILIYSLEEQNAIAFLLSSQELIVKKTKNLIANIEKRNQFMTDELLSGRIRVKDENGQLFLYKNHDDNWKFVTLNGKNLEIPKDWEITVLEKEINWFTTGTAFKTNEMKSKGKYPVIKMTDIKDGKIEKNFKVFSDIFKEKSLLKYGDLVIGLSGSVGKIGEVLTNQEILLNQRCLGLRVNSFKTYVKNILEHNFKKWVDSIVKDGVIPNLSHIEVLNYGIPQISNAEKNIIDNLFKNIHEEKEKYEKILEKEEKTFTFLLEELISGRIRIKI